MSEDLEDIRLLHSAGGAIVISQQLESAINRRVTAEELHEALHREIPAAEREEVRALIRWFTTRYPTAEERLAYVRQAHARWRAVNP
jgi:hypothetical protein